MGNWNRVSFKVLMDERAKADAKFQAERDRRYTEVKLETEKALKIKEVADLAALSLAREIQDYKDEKANNLRSQIEGERGHYATKDEMKPIADYVQGQLGRGGGIQAVWLVVIGGVAVLAEIGQLIFIVLKATGH